MEKITIDELMKKVGTKYGLVNLVSKRAQEMLAGSENSTKASEVINKIFEEIIQDKITIKKEKANEDKRGESEES